MDKGQGPRLSQVWEDHLTFDPKVDKTFVMDDIVYEIVCLRDKFGEETFEEAEARGMIIQHPVDKTYPVVLLQPGSVLEHVIPS